MAADAGLGDLHVGGVHLEIVAIARRRREPRRALLQRILLGLAVYRRAVALELGGRCESLTALRQAERLFSASNIHGRSVAIYRRAMALEVAGRCEEEADELQRYAQLAKPADPELVPHALAHVEMCKLANAGVKTF